MTLEIPYPAFDPDIESTKLLSHAAISSFADQPMDTAVIAGFHLRLRQWQVATGQNTFSNIEDSQVDLTSLEQQYIHPGGNFWLAQSVATRELLGFVGLRRDTEKFCTLERLSVHPGYHRNGIGTRLVRTLIDWAGVHDFDVISLQTGSTENARPICEAAGFEVVGVLAPNNDWLMQLELS